MYFLYPLVLFGLLALVIPLIIHLFNFKKPKRVFFSNVRFLRELQFESRKRSKVKHLLVLLMRLLAFVALIFAFAMPVLRTGEAEENSAGRPLVVIYLDNSYSLQAQGSGGVLLETGMKKAREIAAYYDPSDEFHLITNDFSARFSRMVNRADLMDLVTQIQYSPVSRSSSEVMDRIVDLERRYPGREIIAYLISDFQQSTFNIRNTDMNHGISMRMVPIQSGDQANLYIDSVWTEVPVIRPGQIAVFQVRVGNTGTSVAEEVPVTMTLNGREISVGTTDVPAGGHSVVQLTARIAEEGIYHGVIAIEDHPLIFDDKFFVGFVVRRQRRVTGVYGDRPDPALTRIFEGDSLFVFENTPVTRIDFSAMNSYDIIFCQGVRDFSTGLLDALKTYVLDGGTLVIIPPDPSSDVTGLTRMTEALGIAGYGTTDTIDVRLGFVDYEDPLFQGVFAEKPTNPAMPQILNHYSLNLKMAPGEKVIMRLLNNRPLLLESSSGKGKVYQFAMPFAPSSGNLAVFAELFVPPIYNMALFSGQKIPMYYILGRDKSAVISRSEAREQSVFRIGALTDDYEFIPGHRNEPFGALLFFEDQVTRAGNYRVMMEQNEVAPLAFNYSGQESDLRADTPKALEEWIRENGYLHLSILSPAGKSLTEKLAELNQGIKLWRWFVLAALLFLLTESLLLRFWTKRKQQPTN
jgi:hypothetical protein